MTFLFTHLIFSYQLITINYFIRRKYYYCPFLSRNFLDTQFFHYRLIANSRLRGKFDDYIDMCHIDKKELAWTCIKPIKNFLRIFVVLVLLTYFFNIHVFLVNVVFDDIFRLGMAYQNKVIKYCKDEHLEHIQALILSLCFLHKLNKFVCLSNDFDISLCTFLSLRK